MTKISIGKKGRLYKVNISGHAAYAEKGEDIVCAAISMLYYALLSTVENDKGVSYFKGRHENGFAQLSFCGGKNSPGAFEMAKNGFMLLSRTYPKNVSLDERMF